MSGPKFLHSAVTDSLQVIANAWWQLLLRVAQPVIRFRGQALFHIGPCGFGFCFPFIIKTSFKNCMLCLLCYLWLIFKFVWWSETLKCGKHAKKKKIRKGANTFSHHCTYIHACIHTYMHAYMHTCIHTHIHAYIHTYIKCSVLMSDSLFIYVCMYVYMYVCMYQELLKKPQQIPRVFAHTWRIKLILILILILIHTYIHTYMHHTLKGSWNVCIYIYIGHENIYWCTYTI